MALCRRVCPESADSVRLATAALISASALSIAGAPAQAHHYRHHRYYAARIARSPLRIIHYVRHAMAAVTVASPVFSGDCRHDANSGRTLYSAYENGLRHPASITKVMTLYLLVRRALTGAQSRAPYANSDLRTRCSARGLSKLSDQTQNDQRRGRDQGSRNPFGKTAWRSPIAEAVGHSGRQFRRHNDAKSARARHVEHGLSQRFGASQRRTGHHGAGFDHPRARDRGPFPALLSLLFDPCVRLRGRSASAITITCSAVSMASTGIKTRLQQRASGFNLLTSSICDGRSLIAVVMGSLNRSRDQIMENLIADHIAEACDRACTATMIKPTHRSPEKSAERAALPEMPPIRPRPAAIAANVAARVKRSGAR